MKLTSSLQAFGLLAFFACAVRADQDGAAHVLSAAPAAAAMAGPSDDREEAALDRIREMLRLDPKNAAAYVVRGNIYSAKELWDLAQEDYQSALQVDPGNLVARVNLAEIEFRRRQYELARTDFAALAADRQVGDLAGYNVFLCDLLAAHEAAARQELAAFDATEENASYYFGNVAWDLFHHDASAARAFLSSAVGIYPPKKVKLYAANLLELGYLPLRDPAP